MENTEANYTKYSLLPISSFARERIQIKNMKERGIRSMFVGWK